MRPLPVYQRISQPLIKRLHTAFLTLTWPCARLGPPCSLFLYCPCSFSSVLVLSKHRFLTRPSAWVSSFPTCYCPCTDTNVRPCAALYFRRVPSVASILDQLADIEQCEPVQQLSSLKEELESTASPVMRQVFAWLFPFGPGWNSGAHVCLRRSKWRTDLSYLHSVVLGTFYISSYVWRCALSLRVHMNVSVIEFRTSYSRSSRHKSTAIPSIR